jgi:hypothetical protein
MRNIASNFVFAGLFAAFSFTAGATVIFDNTSSYNGNLLRLSSGEEVGNEVTLGSGVTLTSFQFEYYSPDPVLNAALGVDVKFYANNGPLVNGYPTPAPLIYDSGWFYNTLGGIPTGAHDILYSSSDLYTTAAFNLSTGLPGNVLPSDFTYTITFSNVGTNNIYIPLANNTAGVNYGDYWYNTGSGWSLLTNSVPANTLAVFNGTAVPEPSIVGICSAAGCALIFGVRQLKQKR